MAAVTFLAFLPSLGNDFTNWDDPVLVVGNPLIRDLSPAGVARVFTSFYRGLYNPLTILSHAVEYAAAGLDPRVYHATNLELHIAGTLLVFRLVLLLGCGLIAASFTAALFGVHPLHVESVAWVSERKDVLSSLFYFAALAAYLRFKDTGRESRYVLSLVLFLAALLAKPMAVTLPLVLLLAETWRGTRLTGSRLARTLPFFALSGLFSALALYGRYASGTLPSTVAKVSFPLSEQALILSHRLLFYAERTLLPFKLSVLYPFTRTEDLLRPAYLLAPAVLLLLAAAVAVAARRARAPWFGLLFFLATLLPLFGLLAGGYYLTDRFVYVPLFGLFFIAGAGLSRLARAPRPMRLAALGAAAAVVVLLSALSWRQCLVWRNSFSLWNDAIAKYPSMQVPYNNRGELYNQAGDYVRAIGDFTRALELDPGYAIAWQNRGSAYLAAGEAEKGAADIARARELFAAMERSRRY